MDEFSQELVNGLTLGSVYALIALGFTLIFGALKLIAFAQGGVYMVGAYAGLMTATYLGTGANRTVGFIAALAVAAAIGAILNVLIDRIGYRPIRSSKRLMPLISGIGLYILLENGAGMVFGRQPRAYPSLLPAALYNIRGVRISAAQLVVAGGALVFAALLYVFVSKTGMGLAMRATAERPDTAGLMGIEPERVIMITFAVAGALSGVGGVLVGSYTGVATPVMGFLIGVKAFAAAVIGGIGSVPGAVLGGLSIGVIESMGAGYVSSSWSDAIVFSALVVVLLVRPDGLLGTSMREKV